MWRRGPGLWDDQDNFYYDWLMLPTGEQIPLRLRSIVGLIPLFAVETLEEEVFVPGAAVHATHGMVPRASPRTRSAGFAPADQPGPGKRRLILDRPRVPHEAGAGSHARRNRVPLALRHSRDLTGAIWTNPTCSKLKVFAPKSNTCRRVRLRSVRRQFQLAGTDLDAGELSDGREPVQIWLFLRRGLSGRVPQGLRQNDEPERGGDELRTRLTRDLPARRARPAPVLVDMKKCRPTRSSKTMSGSTNTFDGDNGRGVGANAPDRLDRLFANLIDELYPPKS